MATDVQVPTLGESITEGTLAEWLKKPGEAVAEDEPIASLETDKVSVEVPSPVAGVLTEQLVKQGDNVAVGAVIARIDQGATASVPASPPPVSASVEAPVLSTPAEAAAEATTNPPGAGETPELREPAEAGDDAVTTLSPAVRRAVLEYHVDPTRIRGTGKDGRLTKDDVIAAAEAQKNAPAPAPQAKAPEQPVVTPAKAGAQPIKNWVPAYAGMTKGGKSASKCRACA